MCVTPVCTSDVPELVHALSGDTVLCLSDCRSCVHAVTEDTTGQYFRNPGTKSLSSEHVLICSDDCKGNLPEENMC